MPNPSRFGARKDKNHDEVVAALRKENYIVDETYKTGDGFPDILVWTKTRIRFGVVLEIKFDGGKLNSKEQTYFDEHTNCAKGIVDTPEEALQLMGMFDGLIEGLIG